MGVALGILSTIRENSYSLKSSLKSQFTSSNIRVKDEKFQNVFFDSLRISQADVIQKHLLQGRFYLLQRMFVQFSPLKDNRNEEIAYLSGSTRPSSLLSSLMDKLRFPCPLRLETQHWNLDLLAGSDISISSATRVYLSKDNHSGASIQVFSGDGSKNQLLIERFGLANVLVIRPKVGLIFPTSEEDFLQAKNVCFAILIEDRNSTVIKQDLLPGDLICVLMQVDVKTKVKMSPKKNFIHFLTHYIEEDSSNMESIFHWLPSHFDLPNDLFISLSQLSADLQH